MVYIHPKSIIYTILHINFSYLFVSFLMFFLAFLLLHMVIHFYLRWCGTEPTEEFVDVFYKIAVLASLVLSLALVTSEHQFSIATNIIAFVALFTFVFKK